jgi:hypothetical protein
MKPNRRLPRHIRPSKKSFSASWIFLSILCLTLFGGISTYHFLREKEAAPIPPSLPKKALVEDTSFVPKAEDDTTEDFALIEDLYRDAEVVQLYKSQESPSKEYDYWRYAIENKKLEKSLCAILIVDFKDFDKKVFKKLLHISAPLTFALSISDKAYAPLKGIERKKDWSFAYPLKIDEGLSFKEIGDALDQQNVDAASYTSILTFDSKEIEKLLIHAKQRGLVLVDGSSLPEKTLDDLSYKNLALALKATSFLKHEKLKGKKVIILSLKDLLSPKGKKWIRFQKRHGVQFVSLSKMF